MDEIKKEKVIHVELKPEMMLFLLIVWTLFVYTIGGLFYHCECELVNLKNTVSYSGCHASYNQTLIDDAYYTALDDLVSDNWSGLR